MIFSLDQTHIPSSRAHDGKVQFVQQFYIGDRKTAIIMLNESQNYSRYKKVACLAIEADERHANSLAGKTMSLQNI